MTHGPNRRPVRAFTLIELVTSMGVMLVLMGGIGSAVMLASRAVPAAESVFHASGDTATSLQQIVADLYTATEFIEWSPRAVEFTVHDRDDDTIPESIRYAWSGLPGAPLTYSYNKSQPQAIATNVHAFQLAYGMQKIDETPPSDPNESDETLLFSHDATKDLADGDVEAGEAIGQYFLPSFPPGTSRWSVTRVKFKADADSNETGSVVVRLQTPNPQLRPGGTILEQHVVLESNLDADLWQEVVFSSVSGLSPTQGLCLTIEHGSGSGKAARVRYRQQKATLASSSLLTFHNSAWASDSDAALLFQVYGTITVVGPSQIFPTYGVKDVHLTIQVGGDPAARLETTVQILNEPEVTEGALAIY